MRVAMIGPSQPNHKVCRAARNEHTIASDKTESKIAIAKLSFAATKTEPPPLSQKKSPSRKKANNPKATSQ